nr:guanylate kinase [[Mycoplasma] mobile]
MHHGKIIILSGPSGVGKGSIEKLLLEDEKLKLKFSTSVTSRKPRVNEIEGKDYFFRSEEEFSELIKEKKFIEWSRHLNNYYGTLKSEVDKILGAKFNVLIEIETTGALNILKYYKKKNMLNDVISIFILPPRLEELETRILNRGSETKEEIKIRIKKAKKEIKLKNKFKYNLTNNFLHECVEEVKNILKREIHEI